MLERIEGSGEDSGRELEKWRGAGDDGVELGRMKGIWRRCRGSGDDGGKLEKT